MTATPPSDNRSPAISLRDSIKHDSFAANIVKSPSLLLWAALFALISVPLLTLIDIPIAKWFNSDPLSSDFTNAIELTRSYTHGTGVFFILLSVFLLAPEKRGLLPRVAAMTCGGGAIATIMKMFVLRQKPNQINLDFATLESAWKWRFDWTLDYIATFDGGTRAFPSGNMATAVALTIGLCILVPRGKSLFLSLCVLSLVQRVYNGSHFLSDVVGGSAAGFLWCYICLHPKLIGSLFDKMEPGGELRTRTIPTVQMVEPEQNIPVQTEPRRRAA